jgi:type I restriction enzyme, S subunit
MNSVSQTTLGELIEFQRGFDLPKSQFVKGKYPVQSSNGILGYHNEYKVKGPGITIGRSGTVGFPHLIKQNFYPHNTSLFIKDFKGNDINYIFYLLKNLKLNDRKSGSGVPTMNRNHLHPLKIMANLLKDDQQKIAKVLSDLDAKIELNNKINAELEAMAKLIYDYWFVQFDFPDANGNPYKSSGGKMVYNQELNREIPADWEVKELSDIANITTGKLDSNAEVIGGEYPFYTCAATPTTIDCFEYDNDVILIAGNNATGNFHVNRYTGKFNAYQRTYIVTEKKIEHLDYLYQVLARQMKIIKKRGKGSQTKFITLGMLTEINIFAQNPQLMVEFHKLINPLYKKQINLLYENRKLEALRDWLLPMLMNGQVTVK